MVKEKVFITKSHYNSVDKSVKEIFSRFDLDVAGKKVWVKPNLIGAFPLEKAVTTNPAVVRAVTNYLKEAGAEVIVGDNSGVRYYGDNLRVAQSCGIPDAVGGVYKNIATEVESVSIKSRFTDKVAISKIVNEADIYISLPKLKTHVLTQMTGSIKNNFGFLVGKEKMRCHRIAPDPKEFGELIADIYNIRQPDFVIMDGIVGMDKDGPSAGRAREVGKLIAGINGVAVDTVAATMMGASPGKIEHLRIAGERNWGPVDIKDIDVEGPLEKINDWRMPTTFKTSLGTLVFNRVLGNLIKNDEIVVIKNKCTGCGVCKEACPMGAIRIVNEKAKILPDKCVRCFCCHELCPQSAVRSGGLFGFLQRTTR